MSIIRVVHNRENPYVQINKEALWNPQLSLKAVGLWARCLSRPDNWRFNVVEMSSSGQEGRRAIYSAIEELIEQGYVLKLKHYEKEETGKFESGGVEYIFFEFPFSADEKEKYTLEFKKSFRQCGFGDVRDGNLRNVPLLNTEDKQPETKVSSTTTIKKEGCGDQKKVEERILPESAEGSHLEYTKPNGVKEAKSISEIYRILMPMKYSNSEIVQAINIAKTTRFIGDVMRFLQSTIEKRRQLDFIPQKPKAARYIPGNDNEYTFKGKSVCKIYEPQKITRPME